MNPTTAFTGIEPVHPKAAEYYSFCQSQRELANTGLNYLALGIRLSWGKSHYEIMFPETKHGGDRSKNNESRPLCYIDHIALIRNCHPNSLRDLLAIVEKIGIKFSEDLLAAGLDICNQKGVLESIGNALQSTDNSETRTMAIEVLISTGGDVKAMTNLLLLHKTSGRVNVKKLLTPEAKKYAEMRQKVVRFLRVWNDNTNGVVFRHQAIKELLVDKPLRLKLQSAMRGSGWKLVRCDTETRQANHD